MPFLRSLRWPSTQVLATPYLRQRSQGRDSSHFLHAAAQLVHWEGGERRTVRTGRTYSHFDLLALGLGQCRGQRGRCG